MAGPRGPGLAGCVSSVKFLVVRSLSRSVATFAKCMTTRDESPERHAGTSGNGKSSGIHARKKKSPACAGLFGFSASSRGQRPLLQSHLERGADAQAPGVEAFVDQAG